MWTALLVTGLASFLTPFMLSATNVALPTIGSGFGMDTIALGWIQTSYLLASVPPEDSFVAAMQVAFLVFGVLCAFAVVTSAARGAGNKPVPA